MNRPFQFLLSSPRCICQSRYACLGTVSNFNASKKIRSRKPKYRLYSTALETKTASLIQSTSTEEKRPKARLAALHARIQLSVDVPLHFLARCLLDASAEPASDLNNATAACLGEDLLAFFTAEAIQCRFPRLPTDILFAAVAAYAGPKALAALAREWGVDAAAAPGPEVDPGYLQFRRRDAGNAGVGNTGVQLKEITPSAQEVSSTRPNANLQSQWRRTVSSRTLYEDAYGATVGLSDSSTVTLEAASATFVRAVFGHLYLCRGFQQTKAFFQSHILSRHVDVSTLFQFRQPTLDLAKLCAREGFAPPVARILSETGRQSRHPVFLVGIFSGREKLGEAAGASLDEARIRAAVMALKSWYLYSPIKTRVPSDTVGHPQATWEPLLVDRGEIVT